jgi:hypothetical protein
LRPETAVTTKTQTYLLAEPSLPDMFSGQAKLIYVKKENLTLGQRLKNFILKPLKIVAAKASLLNVLRDSAFKDNEEAKKLTNHIKSLGFFEGVSTFRVKDFLVDSMNAKIGPAFNDFKEAINNGSVFSIITARGHNPNTLKEAVYNYIINGFGGIDKDQLVKNLKKYRTFSDEEDMSDDDLIRSYLELNRYHPVSFGNDGSAASPEELKVMAMDEFVDYVKGLAALLNKKAFLKRDIANKFIPEQPKIGFSDDDLKNVEKISKHFKDKPDNIVKTYSTAGGIKKEYK